MAATITTFGEWCDSNGDHWDDTAAIAPGVVLQSSLHPEAPLALLMSTPEVHLAVAPFAVRPLPGSGVPVCCHAFSGDAIAGDLPAMLTGPRNNLH